ncbi:putative bifunctional diguanylate cyclase/phosphodiesterase [Aquibacillus salsiterrae]|uniref:EAL domain-containing protein n=1 Tax=Aquibacillus salsiterrae TaxID=2950439 RepID=A0A9X4AF84_9BACI|nr:EAL domain-containing protein [Aquibacillus salsiterrae]MDC3417596.1 EAL domain-containing protein [Aquibacillus salsiterrae]
MLKSIQQRCLLIIGLHTFLYYLYLYLTKDNEKILLVGSDVFVLVAALLSFVWLYKRFLKTNDRFKYFWLVLSIGTGCSVIAQVICLYYRLFLNTYLPYPSLADAAWLLQSFLFVVALVIKKRLLESYYPVTRFLFNILIIITVAVTLSWKYLIGPGFSSSTDSILTIVVSMSYPILNLVVLSASISLYFIAQHSINKTVLSLLTISFFAQIVADSVYIFTFMDSIIVDHGIWVMPLWSLSLFLIGFAGNQVSQSQSLKSNQLHMIDRSNLVTNISIVILFILVITFNPTMTEIDVGFLVTFFLLFIKQIITLSENEKLSLGLEQKITERTAELHTTLERMERMANFDPLTKLPNRNVIINFLEDKFRKQEQEKLAVMFIDLDHFKTVNDTMGHEAGDFLLVDVSKRLTNSVRTNDIVARQGGDEFIILVDNVDYEETKRIAERIVDSFDSPFLLRGNEFYTTPSIGISIYPDDATNKDDLIKAADNAMYQSKEIGKNTYQFYGDISTTLSRQLAIESGLRYALENHQMHLEFQPQIDLKTRNIVGIEALLRWEHPLLGNITPEEFIPIAENTGLIYKIGKWVLRTACAHNKAWQLNGYPPITIAVNLSPLQFKDPNFVSDVDNILLETELAPQYLELEITERHMQNIDLSRQVITTLKDLGVSISIDDFGTGYSSLSVLHQLPIDRMKIDQAFINDFHKNEKTSGLVKTITEMGRNLNFELVAEGIESEEQVTILKEYGCHIGQGYLFSYPLKLNQVEQLFNKYYSLQEKHRESSSP